MSIAHIIFSQYYRQTRRYDLRRRAQQRILEESAETRAARLRDLRLRAQQRMGHYYYGIIIHTCAVTSNNISLCALLLSEALLHLMYALVEL